MSREIFDRIGRIIERSFLQIQTELELRKFDGILKKSNDSGWVNSEAAGLFRKDPRIQKLTNDILHIDAETYEERMAKIRELTEELSPAQFTAVVMIQGDLLKKRLEDRS